MSPATTSSYFTSVQSVEAQLVVKRSRFIAWLMPVAARTAIDEALDSRRKKFPDATHHCFAWRIGFEHELQAFSSDASEPSGTAGKPILQALESRRLTNVVCVVTRYFGGTRLGTGGLMRAYSAAAFAAINQAELVEAFPVAVLHLQYDYSSAGAVERVLRQLNARVLSQNFTQNVFSAIEIHRDAVERARELLNDACSGRISIERDTL
jgi:uncharacterized YigZ family protein